MECEWRKNKDAFVGVAEELCGRTSGKGGTTRSRNQGWWTKEVVKAVWEKPEAWKMIKCIKDRGEQPPNSLKAPVWSEEEGSKEGGGQSTEEYGGITVQKT